MKRAALTPVCTLSGRKIAGTAEMVAGIRARATVSCPACGKAVVSRFAGMDVYLSPHRERVPGPVASPPIP